MTGIIELGENSVTLWIYKHDNDEITQVLTMKKAVGLIGYIESGALTPKGIEKACAALVYYNGILNNLGIENLYGFASPFMKNVTNFKETIEQIRERTGLYVMPMSVDEKAELAYYGAAQSLPLQTGVFVDISGGYTEIAVFKDRQLRQAWSIPYGSLNLSLKYIKGMTPLRSHIQSIKKDLKRELKRIKLTEVADRYDICVTGGSAEAAETSITISMTWPTIMFWMLKDWQIFLSNTMRNEEKSINVSSGCLLTEFIRLSPGLLS